MWLRRIARDSRPAPALPSPRLLYLVETGLPRPSLPTNPASVRTCSPSRHRKAAARVADDLPPGAGSSDPGRIRHVAIDLHGGPRSAWLYLGDARAACG
jgi:hypothetical protein